jgi:dephospho-CoA kinase
MLKIGITGGIGTGKTTVCEIFELLGIPVFYADSVGKQLMTANADVKQKVKNLFGDEAYLPDETVNRKHIAGIVFNDQNKLNLLNNIIHPAVKEAFNIWCSNQISAYVIKEAAIMFESNSYQDNDFNILISSPLNIRIDRVMKRDFTSRENVLARMAKQMPEEEKEKLADFIITNDEKTFLIEQVLALDKKFSNLI